MGIKRFSSSTGDTKWRRTAQYDWDKWESEERIKNRQEAKKQKQEENEKRYEIIIKYFIKEVERRTKVPITKKDIATVISDILAKSKHISKRFERRRTRYL